MDWELFKLQKRPLNLQHQTPSIFLLFGSVLFFALNTMWAIYYINLFVTANIAATLISGVGLSQTIFIFLGYLGILPFCVRWGLVQCDSPEKDEEQTIQRGEDQEPPPLAEMNVNPKPSFVAEADSRMVVEADEAKPVVAADSSRSIVETDFTMISKAQGERPPQYKNIVQAKNLEILEILMVAYVKTAEILLQCS